MGDHVGAAVRVMDFEFLNCINGVLGAQRSRNMIVARLPHQTRTTGEEQKARFWCSKFESEIESRERPLAQSEIERSTEVESLKMWLDAGIAVKKLQEVIRSEQRRLGIER